jgi:hypothetical protein
MSEVLDEMIGEMVSGDALGVVKEALEQAPCESVMEDADGVSHALHSIEYLGPSVHAILTSSAAREEAKNLHRQEVPPRRHALG